MNVAHGKIRILAGMFILFAVLCAALLSVVVRAQDALRALTPGVAATGELTSRQEDEWMLRLCTGDEVTVTMQSDEFVPFVALLDPDEELVADAVADETDAVLAEAAIDATGNYVVVAAGERRTARGAYTLTVELADGTLDEPIDGSLAPGGVATDTLRPRRVAAWAFQACAGDVITATVTSAEFEPFLELFQAGEAELIADNAAVDTARDDEEFSAQLAAVEVITSSHYVLLVSGVGRLDAGDYTVKFEITDGAVSAGDVGNGDAVLRTPTRGPARQIRTPTPTRTPTPSKPVCTVVTTALNVRSGPSTVFVPPIGSLQEGDVVDALARDRLGTWIEVRNPARGLRGWVNNSPQFVDCNMVVASLPLGVIPPTPTPTVTPTATPTATPSPTQSVAQAPRPPTEIGIGGGGGGGLAGEIRVDTGLVRDPNGQPTFREAMYLRMLVWDPDAGSEDGAGVDYVEFFIQEQFGDFREVHYRRENSAGYCSFGGGEPLCNELRLRDGARWPETNIPVLNGDYAATIVAHPEGSQSAPSWSVDFTIDSPDLQDGDSSYGGGTGGNGGDNRQPQDLVAFVAQTGPDSQGTRVRNALVFQVVAYDPERGADDGDGIDYVRHEIFGPNGDRVYERQENNVHYCAFSGGEPDCDVFRFTVGGSWWEGTDNPVEAGPHLLRATVHAEDGRNFVVEQVVTIEE